MTNDLYSIRFLSCIDSSTASLKLNKILAESLQCMTNKKIKKNYLSVKWQNIYHLNNIILSTSHN